MIRFPASLLAIVCFLLVTPNTAIVSASGKIVVSVKMMSQQTGFIDRTWLGGQGMITAIIVGL